MGPRRYRRGNAIPAGGLDWEILLQWGHDVTVAEMMKADGMPKLPLSLQWGHDVTVAEMEGDFRNLRVGV